MVGERPGEVNGSRRGAARTCLERCKRGHAGDRRTAPRVWQQLQPSLIMRAESGSRTDAHLLTRNGVHTMKRVAAVPLFGGLAALGPRVRRHHQVLRSIVAPRAPPGSARAPAQAAASRRACQLPPRAAVIVAMAAAGLVAACGDSMRIIPAAGAMAVARVEPRNNSTVRGTIAFTQRGDRVCITANFIELWPGPHSLYIHAVGNCSSPNAASAGPVWNIAGAAPAGKRTGDLPQINAGTEGNGCIADDIGRTLGGHRQAQRRDRARGRGARRASIPIRSRNSASATAGLPAASSSATKVSTCSSCSRHAMTWAAPPHDRGD